MSNITQAIKLNAKNLIGWKTKRKIIVFGVDDYGNVRLNSKSSLDNMMNQGVELTSRFDLFDSLENEEDLLMLYETLSSVKDCNNKNAVFTALSVPANLNFEKMRDSRYLEFYIETLPETFAKLSGYENVWNLWKEGIKNKLIYPQFHGREHLNVEVLKNNLALREKNTLVSLENRSYAGIKTKLKLKYTAAYDYNSLYDVKKHRDILKDGLNTFENVFGFRSKSFNPPASKIHSSLFSTLKENGIIFLEQSMIRKDHTENGLFKSSFNYTGKKNQNGQILIVRNCVFEPTIKRNIDWTNYVLQQIEIAFRWKRPAIISSHRVNFCGNISKENRRRGLSALKNLLVGIVNRWPDVEFMTTVELGELIKNNR